MKKTFWVFVILLLIPTIARAWTKEATPDARWLKERWKATWISCPGFGRLDYGVYHFRKTFELSDRPEQYVINISADNRYRLYVNGQSVCFGPARGDRMNWYFETVDIAPFLVKGKNVLAVEVWNCADYTPAAQVSFRTGLIVQGNTEQEFAVNSGNSWRAIRNSAYTPILENRHDVGCSDDINGSAYPWGWQSIDFDDRSWVNAQSNEQGIPYGNDTELTWFLTPRDIPFMEERTLRIGRIRKTSGVTVDPGFLKGDTPVEIAPHSRVSILFDQNYLTTAYPELCVSRGTGSRIKLSFAEAMYDGNGKKGNRNEVEDRSMGTAIYSIFRPDGGLNRLFRPLWFKTYRYILMEIETAEESLVLHDFLGKYTAYPFQEKGSFSCDDPRIVPVWEVGWRTARLCAHETYYDCPYYEQLQYIGDTRIQALISLYVSGDDRLMRKALRMFDCSRTFEGITASRYPSRIPQYIPTFSLYWINMVHDYYMHRVDDAFIHSFLPGISTVLAWFTDKINSETGLLGATPHWNFTDWAKSWPWNNEKPLGGVPTGGYEGGSAITTLQFVYALQDAVSLFDAFGDRGQAEKYARLANKIRKSVAKRCWNERKQLMEDGIGYPSLSQHANIMAILTDAVPRKKQAALFDKILSNGSLEQATFYYRFYLVRAMNKVGKADLYMSTLQPWYDMLDMGLTTFAENPEPTRSDCHAWSASPNYELLATVCGITPASPGFRTVRIAPHLGTLKKICAVVPHPLGEIRVDLNKNDQDELSGTIILPEGLSGNYQYNKLNVKLKSGINRIL